MEPKNYNSQLIIIDLGKSCNQPSITSALQSTESDKPIKHELENNLPDTIIIEDRLPENGVKIETGAWETEDSYIEHELEILPTEIQQYCPPATSVQLPTTNGKPHPIRPFACDLCDAKYTRISALNIHKRNHTGDKPFCCEQCQSRFFHHSQLTAHMRRHTNERYICKICESTFTYSGGLSAHMRQHSGDLPHRCDVCGNSYVNPSKLKSHLRKHGEKALSCELCDVKFAHSSSLKKHMQRKHKAVGQ